MILKNVEGESTLFLLKINEDLSLKLIAPNDAIEIFDLTDTNREYLKTWLPWLNGTLTSDSTVQFIQSCMNSYAQKIAMTFSVLYCGKIVGVASYNSLDWTNKSATIGYWLGENHQGKGLMTKVVTTLTNYAFKELKLNRVEIRAAVQNKKNRRIPEKLGFRNEGCIREAEWLYDHYVDHVIYSKLASDAN